MASSLVKNKVANLLLVVSDESTLQERRAAELFGSAQAAG